MLHGTVYDPVSLAFCSRRKEWKMNNIVNFLFENSRLLVFMFFIEC